MRLFQKIKQRACFGQIMAWHLVCAFLMPINAPAQDVVVDGIHVEHHVTLNGSDLKLNGAGLRTLWGFHIYVAALYLPVRDISAENILAQDVPRRMRITLLRDISTEQNLKALKGGLISNNTETELTAINAEVEHFLSLLRRVHSVPAGSVILFDYLPGQGTHIRVGDQDLGWIPGARFNLAVLRIWLGEDPIQLSLKKALLGLPQQG